MAKINITVDTETNEYSVEINGSRLNNVASVNIWFPNEYWACYYPCDNMDKIKFEATQAQKDNNKIKQVTYTTAAKQDEKPNGEGLYMTASVANPTGESALKGLFKCN